MSELDSNYIGFIYKRLDSKNLLCVFNPKWKAIVPLSPKNSKRDRKNVFGVIL